jgi:hypothetical protein
MFPATSNIFAACWMYGEATALCSVDVAHFIMVVLVGAAIGTATTALGKVNHGRRWPVPELGIAIATIYDFPYAHISRFILVYSKEHSRRL